MTPTPKPGILDISPYVGGRASRARRGEGLSSCPPTKARWARAPRRSQRWSRPPRRPGALSRRQRPASCARRSARLMAWTRRASWPAATAPTRCSPCWPMPICARRRSAVQRARLSRLQDRHPAPTAPCRWMCRRNHQSALSRCRCDAGGGDAEDAASSIIANPNNPTGSYLTNEEMRRLHAGLSPRYAAGDRCGLWRICQARMIMRRASRWCRAIDNVVMTRTFSKIHGLAGLRIGWAYAPASVCDVLNRIRGRSMSRRCSSMRRRRRSRDRAHVGTCGRA